MAILEVRDLYTSFFTSTGEVRAVNGVSFDLEKGKVLGIVGESGSGKSVTVHSILQILSHPGRIVSGSVLYNGRELVGISDEEMREIRGNKISIIFQDTMTSLNPTLTIGSQLTEVIMLHTDRNRREAKKRAGEMLYKVGISEPERRIKQYPHELSGGMRQRVMIAMALACEPDILIADEPTTALDVTVQAQILDLINRLRKENGMSVIMVSHDLGVIAGMCDEVIVMYAGRIVERGGANQIFYTPMHEYTKELLRSVPNMNDADIIPLHFIGGTPAAPMNITEKGCAFASRCKNALRICFLEQPKEYWVDVEHRTSCWMNVKNGCCIEAPLTQL